MVWKPGDSKNNPYRKIPIHCQQKVTVGDFERILNRVGQICQKLINEKVTPEKDFLFSMYLHKNNTFHMLDMTSIKKDYLYRRSQKIQNKTKM